MATSRPPRTEIQPDLWLDARRALWLARPRLLVVADLHWGYASSHRAQGNLLPAWGDEEIAARLQALVADYQPDGMVWLGDSLHTLAGRRTAEDFLRSAGIAATVLAGNHDRRWPLAEAASHCRDGFFFHHGDTEPAVPEGCVELIGHHHPAVSWSDGAGGHLRLSALVASARRLILPAFSPWAAGTPWNHRLLPGEVLWAIAPTRIFPLPPRLAREA
ncbi:MAG TPA: metallophosphoesterase [Opitutaceae bacterium]|nr:metallophosphoesterase [Opitutaceae bacterium]